MAYIFNPYTHGLDFTDKRILEPLEQDFSDLVLRVDDNESLSKQNRNKRNNETHPRIDDLEAANTAIYARVLTLESTDITIDYGISTSTFFSSFLIVFFFSTILASSIIFPPLAKIFVICILECCCLCPFFFLECFLLLL